MNILSTAQPWPTEEADKLARIARAMFVGDHFHKVKGCIKGGPLARENCGTCVLKGYAPRSRQVDGFDGYSDGPNYAGWARLYVEAKWPIRRNWMQVFQAERSSDNERYAAALERSIATFGVTWTDSQRGFRE